MTFKRVDSCLSVLRGVYAVPKASLRCETVQIDGRARAAELASSKTLACQSRPQHCTLAELRHRSAGLVLATASQFSHQRHRRTGKAGILGLSPCSNCWLHKGLAAWRKTKRRAKPKARASRQ